MIDVCFSRMAEGWLKEFKKNINSDGIFHLGGYLDIGDISENIQEHYAKEEAETLRYYYKDITDEEITETYKYELKQIRTRYTKFRKHLDNGQSVRVWISRSANDYCGLLWFCDEIKECSNKLFVVICPPYEYSRFNEKYEQTFGWGIQPETILNIVHTAKEIGAGEKDFFAQEWQLLVARDKPLRILIEDSVVSADRDFFDSEIIRFIPESPQPQDAVMGKFLGSWQCGSVAFLSERIERMIENGLVKVAEEHVDDEGCYWKRMIVRVI